MPPEDVERHYREHVLATCAVTVAEIGGAPRGSWRSTARAMSPGSTSRRRRAAAGIGAALIAAAKAARPEGLLLWTFVANEGARRFYAREGFVESGRTEGENEEGLPDVLLDLAAAGMTGRGGTLLPVLTVIAGIVLLWYVLAVVLNAAWAYDQAGRDGVDARAGGLVAAT